MLRAKPGFAKQFGSVELPRSFPKPRFGGRSGEHGLRTPYHGVRLSQ